MNLKNKLNYIYIYINILLKQTISIKNFIILNKINFMHFNKEKKFFVK